ncbi:helicase associated domain-containing protein [Paeniglutamicibacter antarcticus]|uniref:Helicase associated domain-containing protein n=1 Tax=Arthrobacter terrae TaxID=2935737 RepID=A0A931CM77_9MICC|nr:helicase associated domain-containing protein [Arthrobacter terrae]MBG0738740.1 helicase associated domain-containing protein [Arthrobacter terrae]
MTITKEASGSQHRPDKICRSEMRRLRLVERLTGLKSFVEANGRLPRTTEDRSLAAWMYHQLKGHTTDPFYVLVREEIEGIHRELGAPDGTSRSDENARRRRRAERLLQLKAFTAEHGRLPNERAEHKAERSLAGWMRSLFSSRTARPEYDQVREEVESIRRDHDAWSIQLRKLQDFIAANGRRPTHAENTAAATWLDHNIARLREGRLHEKRASELSAFMEECPDTLRSTEWDTNFISVTAWFKAHGCLPRRRSNDPDELRLANWLNWNRRSHRVGALSATQSERIAGLEPLRASGRRLPGS